MASTDDIVGAALAEPDGIYANVADLTILERDVPCAIGLDHRLDRRGRLRRLGTARRKPARRGHPLGVVKSKASEGDVLHEPAFGGVALEDEEFLGDGSEHLDLG